MLNLIPWREMQICYLISFYYSYVREMHTFTKNTNYSKVWNTVLHVPFKFMERIKILESLKANNKEIFLKNTLALVSVTQLIVSI